jgi:formate/nitrite transporter FocA (FNT family)
MPEGCHGMTDSQHNSTKGLLSVSVQIGRMIWEYHNVFVCNYIGSIVQNDLIFTLQSIYYFYRTI